ncbi:MAG: hypothetical protein PF503_25690 [Desulfobacula sp.]|jgi:hypothetical protein|nr:hypothetical protein [Desulfobacula sp.]
MQSMLRKTLLFFVFILTITLTASPGWGGEITFAGVTHMVNSSGVFTNIGVGIDVYPSDVTSAYVNDPDGNTIHTYSANEFHDDYGDKYYWISLPGPPKIGMWTFKVEFVIGDDDSETDVQKNLVVLPVIRTDQIIVEGNHTTTPTFTWPDVSPGNFYRLVLFDENWNTLYRTSRSSDTIATIPAGTLNVGTNYQARVEVHDSINYDTLNNRSNGDDLYLDAIIIPFVGVTNVNSLDGLKTYLDLGINVPPEKVAQAYVTGPGDFRYDYLPGDYLSQYNEYFKSIDGSPALGEYTFTVELLDGTFQSVTDNQVSNQELPILYSTDYVVIGDDGVTPTFKWMPPDERILFYRARIFDDTGLEVVRTPRLGGTAFTTLPGQLMPNTTYRFRVEIHDSQSWELLNNRSNGELFNFTTGDLPGPPTGLLKVIPVPWVATAPLIPHDTYNGKTITFKAIARGGDGTYVYDWDFDGDGVYDFTATTNDPYDLSATYVYPDQTFDKIFIARISVTSGGQVVTSEYPVRVHATATQSVMVNVAIDEALWWMHKKLQRWDSGQQQFGILPDQMLGATGATVQAWENQGHKPGGNFENNPYVEDVQRGLNFILSKTNPYPIHMEDTRDPDTNANGYGLQSIYQSQLYETGIVMMALASTGDIDRICTVGGFGMFGRTYGEIVQDMADFLAFAQNEPDVGVWRGGWRYAPNYEQSDMSVTQWPVIGLEAAQSNYGTIVPQYVKDELEIYLAADQDANGGFGYTAPGGNVARTGAGIACLAWCDVMPEDPSVIAAMGFINQNWDWDHLGNLYAMYAVMKGMRGFEPDLQMIEGHYWYSEYADFMIAQQGSDGSWGSNAWYGRDLSTASGVLILTPEVFLSPPVAVAKATPVEASPGTLITFDHSDSFHRDPQRTLTLFKWDFDEDGIWDFESEDITSNPTWIYNDSIVCGEEVSHKVLLEVEDDLGNTDVDDETVIVKINLDNHPPVADGDPTDSYPNYYVSPGEEVVLDATQSYDPDETQGDTITLWEWDLDNDGTFEATGETYSFLVPYHWEAGSLHAVSLRVTDDGSWASDCGGEKNLTGEQTIILAVSDGFECSNAKPSISKLWPPNHEMVDIHIIGVTNPDGEPPLITITGITQDEPLNDIGDGNFSPDGTGVGTDVARIRAERAGIGNGRVYTIRFIAQDSSGAMCQGEVTVSVSHSKKAEAIDDGQIYDSTDSQ